MNTWKVIRFVIIVGCFIGAYAYMDSVSSQRSTERSLRNMRSQEALRQITKYKEQEKMNEELEEKKKQEFEENANNAEYQVNYWYDIYRKLLEKSILKSRMSSAQIAELERETKEAKGELMHWMTKRELELISKRDEAEASDNFLERDKYDEMLEELRKKAKIIADGNNNEDE